MEENVEYVEREDEFDIHPIEEIHKRIQDQEDDDIDVLSVEPNKKIYERGDFHMPVLLEVEDSDSEEEMVAVGAGQYRRKSPGQGREWMLDDDTGTTQNGSEQSTPRKAKPHPAAKRRRVDTET